jgi:hypothetical protein
MVRMTIEAERDLGKSVRHGPDLLHRIAAMQVIC